MNREEREQMVDRLLNEAFAPDEIEPRAGLEQRIVATLRAQPEPRRLWRWLWFPTAATAAVLLVVALWIMRPHPPAKAPVVTQHPAPAVKPVPTPPVVAAARTPVRKRPSLAMITRAKAAPPVPRQPVFASARLSQAESALVAMLESKPAEAQTLFQQQQQTRLEASEFMEQAMTPRR